MESEGFCKSLTSKLIYFLPCETEDLKNRACARHAIHSPD